MTVHVRPRGNKWQVHIRFKWPDGTLFEERRNALVKSQSAAQRWGEERETMLLKMGKEKAFEPPPAAIPTLGEFWPRVLVDHYQAERRKASTVADAKQVYKNYLAAWEHKKLSQISDPEIAELKGRLAELSAKRANNVLSVLSVALTKAVKWKVLDRKPEVTLLPIHKKEMPWYEVPTYRRLVEAAKRLSSNHHVLILLMGSAGLRRGEVIALRWRDVDFERRSLHIENAIWQGIEDAPKGGRFRKVTMTKELAQALEAHPRVEGEDGEDRVLYSFKGVALTKAIVRNWVYEIEKEAGMEETGRAHIFRHSFCSHLALAGAPAKAIQELAGHSDLKTTEKYMHLSPANRKNAIGLLEGLQSAGE